MVLHLGDEDFVAGLEGLANTGGDQIDRLGAAPGPHDLVGGRSIQIAGDGLAGGLEGLGRFIGQGVQAAVDIGIATLHRRRQGVDHRARLLRRGGRVQIDQRLAVHLPRQDRELGPDGVDVEVY